MLRLISLLERRLQATERGVEGVGGVRHGPALHLGRNGTRRPRCRVVSVSAATFANAARCLARELEAPMTLTFAVFVVTWLLSCVVFWTLILVVMASNGARLR